MSDDATDAGFLQSFLAERDTPCPNCGYNLRCLTSDRCPECAEGLRLQVGLQEPRLAAYVGGLIGLASGAGFGGLLLAYALIRFSARPTSSRFFNEFVAITGLGFLIHMLALMAWIRMRRYLRACAPARRGLLVLLCWALPITLLAVFTGYIR